MADMPLYLSAHRGAESLSICCWRLLLRCDRQSTTGIWADGIQQQLGYVLLVLLGTLASQDGGGDGATSSPGLLLGSV